MTITKAQLIETLKDLPEEFTTEELFDKILFMQKIDKGLLQSLRNDTYSLDEVKKKLAKWLN